MAKTLILTQEQLNEIIQGSSELGAYLNTTGNGFPPNGHSNETTVTAGGVEGDDHLPNGKKPTTDDVTDMMGPPTNHWPGPGFGGRGGRVSGIPTAAGLGEVYTKRDFEKKMLQELNDQLAGVEMTAAVPNPSDPANPTLVTGDENKLSTELSRAKQSGEDLTAGAIQKTLNAKRGQIKNQKEINSKVFGMPNQYQKAGGRRNTGGKAHTPKTDNMVQIIDNNQ